MTTSKAMAAYLGYVVNPTVHEHNRAWRQARDAKEPYVEVRQRRRPRCHPGDRSC